MHFMLNNVFLETLPFMSCVEKYCRAGEAHMTIRRMRNACYMTKATNTHSEYVIRIAF
jgi:hypothetical protein